MLYFIFPMLYLRTLLSLARLANVCCTGVLSPFSGMSFMMAGRKLKAAVSKGNIVMCLRQSYFHLS